MGRFSREELLIGPKGLAKLQAASVAVFGAGGVGGYTIEALARSGVGSLTIVDGDAVSLSNCNRQILALDSSIGQNKAKLAARRARDINPDCRAAALPLFFTQENAGEFDFSSWDYVVDAIDMVTSKLLLIELARAAGTPVISCMGAGNRFDPTALRAAAIEETSMDPLARVMRRELKKRGISGVRCVYSLEPAAKPLPSEEEDAKKPSGRPAPGSTAFVPAAAGLLLAAQVVRELLADEGEELEVRSEE